MAAGLWAVLPVRGDVTPAPLFRDHAVLQQAMPVPVWGLATPGEAVTVSVAGQTATATADANGRWLAKLPPLPAGGPFELVIAGRNQITLHDILVGEVWLCSGQSNMEMRLGPGKGVKPVVGWQSAVASADLPMIRHFGVARALARDPADTVQGEWIVSSPATAPDFTAVGFFFARALHAARGVPVGLIHSSWGGTPAEAWMSGAALDQIPEFAAARAELAQLPKDPAAAQLVYEKRLDAWYAQNDAGEKASPTWSAPGLSLAGWDSMNLPANWEKGGLGDFDGLVWFRREFDLPAAWEGHAIDLHLGAIDDNETTYVNGQRVGATAGWDTPRIYRMPPGLLHHGSNLIAVRVLDTGGGGGLWGNGVPMQLTCADDAALPPINLEGPWRYRAAGELSTLTPPPVNPIQSSNVPAVLYNGMIHPLLPYALRGVLWYQGESNAARAHQYRSLFPALIRDWRHLWGQGFLPFLFVQIAPHSDMPPEIREAQFLTLRQVPNTAMAVTLDVGDEQDIHPNQKQPVGERLALAARALAYGEQLEYSGPLFERAEFTGTTAVLHFSHLGGGLVAPGGELIGFTLAGADRVFHPAKAVIKGDTVEVSAEAVAHPVAARYAWANFPLGNLYNRSGLPASPFRTDVD